MKYLLDINVLLAAIWANHPLHSSADTWLAGKSIAICPIAELGFLRISTNKKAIAAPMKDARKALEKFLADTKPTHLPDDVPALDSNPETSDQVTDHYLATLAARHGCKFATFDRNINHTSVEVIEGSHTDE